MMTSSIYPCKKCSVNIPDNLGSICRDICNQWYHVNCSGLTLKTFKKICKQIDSIWYCISCIKENFPFGNLGEKTFEGVINKKQSNTQELFLKQYIKTNKFKNMCSICNKNSRSNGTLPCSICKNLIHKKCSKIKGKLTNPSNIMNWICPKCLNEIFPFHSCTNDDIFETHYTQNTEIQIDITKIRDEYNFFHMINETDNNEKIENDFCNIHCDYYDLDEFQKITKTMSKKYFSILHSNISSLRANGDNLQVLLSQITIIFNVISLTEIWNNQEKNKNFNPIKIDGYHKFNGLPGTTLKSGCGFYIRENIDFVDRLDLDKHNKIEKNEFTAKWIEIINKNDSNILIASIYRHPSKNDTPFYDYLNLTLSKIMKGNKLILTIIF